MNEDEVHRIALEYIAGTNLDPCQIVSVQRFAREGIEDPETIGDEWVVQVRFPDGEGPDGNFGMIIVDDATRIARVFECL